jgi:MFS family permease
MRRVDSQRWAGQTFASLAVRSYRILWLGTLTSFLAFFMSTVVNSVVAFRLTGANRAVGAVIFAQGISMFVLGPIGGAIADRWPKRRVIAVGQGTTSAVFVALALLVYTGSISVAHLAIGSFALGVCFAFVGPARQALAVEFVSLERAGNAMALSQIANNASRIGGPALAGVLLAWDAVGAGGAYVVMSLLYAMSAASLVLLPESQKLGAQTGRVLGDVVDGLRYVQRQPVLRVLVLQFLAVIMAGFPYVTVMPGLVEHELGRPAEAISLLMGTSALGGLLTSLVVARYADAPRARALTTALGLGFALTLVAMSLAPNYAFAVPASFALGAASGGFQTLGSTVVIHATEPAYIGRVMSLTMMAFAGFGVMGLPIGWLADAVGVRGALVAMAIAVATAVAVSVARLARVETMIRMAD